MPAYRVPDGTYVGYAPSAEQVYQAQYTANIEAAEPTYTFQDPYTNLLTNPGNGSGATPARSRSGKTAAGNSGTGYVADLPIFHSPRQTNLSAAAYDMAGTDEWVSALQLLAGFYNIAQRNSDSTAQLFQLQIEMEDAQGEDLRPVLLLLAAWGAIAGFTGGIADAVMMRVVDIMLAIPAIFILIYLSTVFHPTIGLLIVVISLLSWLVPARLVRGDVLSLRTREFVAAVRIMGGGKPRVVLRHLVPNTFGTIVVSATFQVADAVILLATLSFLGFGLPPPATTWGSMLSQGTTYLLDGYWWEVYPAGIVIMVTVIAFNFVGDALRDALDTRLRER